jgi:hypothetical protein
MTAKKVVRKKWIDLLRQIKNGLTFIENLHSENPVVNKLLEKSLPHRRRSHKKKTA